jgi:DNA-binding MarR family transcriptional regulator
VTTATVKAERQDAILRLGQSFKRAMVAVRRLRGRETHRPGTPSFAQYPLLFALAERDDLSSGELAFAADVSPATVTGLLDSLGELGLISRSRSSSDRRIVTCSLTTEGRRVVEERRAVMERLWDEALSEFSPDDLAVAAAVFDRIGGMFAAMSGEPEP